MYCIHSLYTQKGHIFILLKDSVMSVKYSLMMTETDLQHKIIKHQSGAFESFSF